MIAPDHWFKYNTSGTGAYKVAVPDLAADAPLLLECHQIFFVNHLRICFHWGACLDWRALAQVPAHEFAFPTRDLLPL